MNSNWLKSIVTSVLCLSVISGTKTLSTNEFNEEKIEEDEVIAIAIPFGYKEHKLELIEQISGKRQCWSESGTAPVTVDLLLLNFDYRDSCRRIKDSNGYSIRIDGNEEKSSLYLISVVQRNGELQVVAKHENPNLPELIVGRSKGLAEGVIKIDLEPGWNITKRNYQGNTLGHLYFSGNSTVIGTNPGNESRSGLPQPSPEVAGVFQVFQSDLDGCEPGNYDISGQFDSSLTRLTITQATGAEGCFDTLPVTVFNTPNLLNGGEPIEFNSNAAPGKERLNGRVRRVHGSFTTPITYPNASDTIGLLAVNSQNIVVKDPIGETINENTTIITDIPAPPEMPISEVLPDLIPGSSPEDKQTRDNRPGSDTEGLIVVRDRIRIVFDDDATVEDVNTAIEAIGGGIEGSFEGGTAVTVKIPDTGDLSGVDNAEDILSTQPSVVVTVPVIIDEVPILPSTGLPLTPPTTPCPTGTTPPQSQENTPQYLQVTGAFDSTGARPQSLGANPPNIFVVDWFSNPNHDDVNLENPIDGITARNIPIVVDNKLDLESLTAQNLKSYLCDKLGIGCPEKVDKRTPPLDPDGDVDVALFDGSNNSDQFRKDGTTPNNHGFLVSGIMAAENGNNCGVVGMYPSNAGTNILAFNAVRSNTWDVLLHTLQHVQGQHVVNYSGGLSKLSEKVSLENGLWWMSQIRQRKLEDRVILVQSAGNESDRSNPTPTIAKAEHNGTWTAAGLTDIRETSRKTRCKGFLGLDCTEIYKDRTYGRLKNVLVVEALDTVTGDYADYSSEVLINPNLAVRAFGESSDPNCTLNNRFPALTSNNGVVCINGGGTSSAAPQVAGLAAWVWSRESNLTAPQVVDVIRDNQTIFQRLDNAGNPDADTSGNPVMSAETAINVPNTLTAAAGLSLTSCEYSERGRVLISSDGQTSEYPLDYQGNVYYRASQENIKPIIEEYGYDADAFLTGEYGDRMIGDGYFYGIQLLEAPEACQ